APGFLRGHVVDFVSVGWFPVFNVADSCITIGAILLIWRSLRAPVE
ncbi:MAG: signal peptidase II, partial [Acidimicrobiia bacterium]